MLAESVGRITEQGSSLIDFGQGHFKDNGCPPEKQAPNFPSCLTCPAPICRFDDEKAFWEWVNKNRWQAMVYFSQWFSVEQIARIFKQTERTVFRARVRVLGPESGAKCKWGHERTEENSRWRQNKRGAWWLACLTCMRNNEAERRRKRKERNASPT